MSALLHPVGPEPETTYWVRRAVVLIALAIAIALVWSIVSLFTPAGTEDALSAVPQVPTPSATATATDTTGASTPGSPAASGDSSASPIATPSPTPTGPVECDPASVGLKVTGQSPVTVRKVTKLTVSFTNTATYECTINLVKNPMELRIYSGTDRIWSTDDCSTWPVTGSKSLKSGAAWTQDVSWPGRRSRAVCALRPEALQAGTYVATLLMDGNVRPSQFVMQVKAA